jgi:site-specific DNA-methyltransferase (adenine-specific)
MFVSGKVIVGDNRETLKSLADGSVQCVVTSPPYWGLRDYGNDDQIGHEPSPEEFVEQLCLVFDEVWRVLADDGTVWVNLGDSYFEKCLAGSPWLFAFAMKRRGWFLRQDIIWAKPNPMPESVTDRCTKSHEYIFLLSKSANYYFDHLAIREPAVRTDVKDTRFGGNKYGDDDSPESRTKSGNVYVEDGFRNKRDVWTVTTTRYADAHFATYNPELIRPCILAGTKEGDLVLDPFSGSGTTGEVAMQAGRNYVGLELNPDYAQLSLKRISDAIGMFGEVEVIK